METRKRKCKDVEKVKEKSTKRVKGRAANKNNKDQINITTKNNRSKTQGRSLDDENTKKSTKLSCATEGFKKNTKQPRRKRNLTTESDDTDSSGSSLDEDYELEENPKYLIRKQSKKISNKKKTSKELKDQPSTSARESETSYDSWLIPNSINEERDSNNRRIVNIDHSGEGIEDIKNLKFPEFIKKENIRDKNMRRPDENDYDPSTVYIPKEEFKKLTPGMQQYWKIKKNYFDSVVIVRFGYWFFVYFHDIIALNRVSEKPININHALHGFPQSQKEKYIEAFTNIGYKVVVVEQTETTEMMIKRIESKGSIIRDKYSIVNREIYGIYTKGTYQKPEKGKLGDTFDSENYLDNRNVLVYNYDSETNEFGFTFFDVSTLKCVVGQFEDDSMLNKFQTLVSIIMPVEVVCSSKLKKTDMTKICSFMHSKPSFSFIKNDKLINLKDSKIIIEHYFGGKHKIYQKAVKNIIEDYNNHKYAAIAFGQAIRYLEDLMIADKTITLMQISQFEQ